MKPSIKKAFASVEPSIPQEEKRSFAQTLNSRATMVGPVLEEILDIGRNLSGINFAQPPNYKRV